MTGKQIPPDRGPRNGPHVLTVQQKNLPIRTRQGRCAREEVERSKRDKFRLVTLLSLAVAGALA